MTTDGHGQTVAAISGIWVPLITPFLDGALDLKSYDRLLEHYLEAGVTGIFPLGTTGECPTLDEDEMEIIVERPLEVAAGRAPVFVGIGGNATKKVVKEANPMPIKYCLWRLGLIRSPECRLPLTHISQGLADELDRALQVEAFTSREGSAQA